MVHSLAWAVHIILVTRFAASGAGFHGSFRLHNHSRLLRRACQEHFSHLCYPGGDVLLASTIKSPRVGPRTIRHPLPWQAWTIWAQACSLVCSSSPLAAVIIVLAHLCMVADPKPLNRALCDVPIKLFWIHERIPISPSLSRKKSHVSVLCDQALSGHCICPDRQWRLFIYLLIKLVLSIS